MLYDQLLAIMEDIQDALAGDADAVDIDDSVDLRTLANIHHDLDLMVQALRNGTNYYAHQ